MTIIIHGSVMLRLLCALLGGVIYFILVNSKPLRRKLRHRNNLRFIMLIGLVLIPLIFPTLGWIINLFFITIFVYKMMYSKRR